MAWVALADKQTGELVSVGTVIAADRFDVLDCGDAPPDFGQATETEEWG